MADEPPRRPPGAASARPTDASPAVTLRWRRCTDPLRLHPLHRELAEAEAGRPADPARLAMQLERLLLNGAEAWLFESAAGPDAGSVVGYVLLQPLADGTMTIRHFLVTREFRRRGIGRAILTTLRRQVHPDPGRWRLDVLVGNAAGRAFWRACGFGEVSVTMALDPAAPRPD